jgi:uncharacterized protein (TIGR03000 family)
MFKHCLAGVGGVLAAAGFLLTPGHAAADTPSTSFAIAGGYSGGFISSFYPGYFGFPGYYHGAPASYSGLGYQPPVFGSYYSAPSSNYLYAPYYGGYSFYPRGRQGLAAWKARIHVKVARSDAVVTVNGHRTRQQGKRREFRTPALALGRPGTYRFTARWQENGKEMTCSRRVAVRPGQRLTLDLTRPARKVARR